MTLIRGFATVGAMTIVSRVLGFARDVLMAADLGSDDWPIRVEAFLGEA